MPPKNRKPSSERYYAKNKQKILARAHFKATGCKCGKRFGVVCTYQERKFNTHIKKQKAFNALFYGKSRHKRCPLCKQPIPGA